MGHPSEQAPEQESSGVLDRESDACLAQMAAQSEVLANRVPSVKSVLVVLSAKGMVFDQEALRQQILSAYPDSVVFFQSTGGSPIGSDPPEQVDLLIDFTGPGQRQGFFYSKKLRRRSRVAVGRNAGLFRKRIYDRVFDENSKNSQVPQEILARERYTQKKVLSLAGVGFFQAGETLADRSYSIALELPGIQRL